MGGLFRRFCWRIVRSTGRVCGGAGRMDRGWRGLGWIAGVERALVVDFFLFVYVLLRGSLFRILFVFIRVFFTFCV